MLTKTHLQQKKSIAYFRLKSFTEFCFMGSPLIRLIFWYIYSGCFVRIFAQRSAFRSGVKFGICLDTMPDIRPIWFTVQPCNKLKPKYIYSCCFDSDTDREKQVGSLPAFWWGGNLLFIRVAGPDPTLSGILTSLHAFYVGDEPSALR